MSLPVHIASFELKRYLTNRGELAFSIALPVALFALMYGAFGGDEAPFHVTVDLVDLDGGVHARELVARLGSSEAVTVRERSLSDADAALERSAILNAVVIPAGFSAALDENAASGVVALGDPAAAGVPQGVAAGLAAGFGGGGVGSAPVAITIKRRGGGGLDGQVVQGATLAVAQEIAVEARARRFVHAVLDGSGVEAGRIDTALNERLADERSNPAVDVATRVVGGAVDEVDPIDRMAPGIIVMFLMFALTMGAQTLVEERQNGTLERLMTTRLGVNGLFAGKFLAGALRATAQAAALLTLAFVGLRLGGAAEFAQLLAFSALVAGTVSALGLAIGSVARSRDQAIWSAVAITMFMSVFGGAFIEVPSDGPLDVVSRVTLTRYAIDAMYGILAGGETLADQWLGAAVMAVCAAALLVAARVMFRVAGGGR